MPSVLFLHGNKSSLPHATPAKELGYETVLLKQRPAISDGRVFDRVIKADIFDLEDVFRKISGLKIEACVTRFEACTPVAAAVCERLGLPSPSLESALNMRDKAMMRQAIAGPIQPRFHVLNSAADLGKINLPLPFLLKPSLGAKSRFVMSVRTKAELPEKFKLASSLVSRSKNPLFRTVKGLQMKNRIIAEELMTGRQVTATSFVFGGKVSYLGFADVKTMRDVHDSDSFNLLTRTTPSVMSKNERKKTESLVNQAVKSLGADNIPLHPELMMTDSGPKIVEIAGRLGGYRAEMSKAAFGTDLNRAALQIALGQKPDLKKRFEKASTAVEVWRTESGIIKSIENLEEVSQMKGVQNFKLRKKAGSIYKAPPFGDKPIATFFANASTPKRSLALANEAMEKLKLVIK